MWGLGNVKKKEGKKEKKERNYGMITFLWASCTIALVRIFR
jgi:hypothetical protein